LYYAYASLSAPVNIANSTKQLILRAIL